ncbi:HDOD domain-containing protein [bacterium]|nr:HDOD domain-containing protein [bacterium]
MSPADKNTQTEIRGQVDAFIRHLSENQIIGEPAARRAYEQVGRIDLRMGRIALLEGFIAPEEINKILWIQREALDKKFGEIALELGVMQADEVRRCLELQQNDFFGFCQCLILDGLIAPQTLFALLKGFLEESLEAGIEVRRGDLHERVSKSIRDVLKKITVVTPMPDTVANLMQMLNDPNVDLAKVAAVINRDVGLTAMLLRLSNSAFHGLKSEVTSVSKAVTVIGVKKLRQLVLSAALLDNFKNIPRDRFSAFWEHSVRVAQWSKELAVILGHAESDEYFLAGFLHNIGVLILLEHFPMESRKIEALVRSGKSSFESELGIMGCDVSDIGSYLLSLWQLPVAVVQAAMLAYQPRIHVQQMSGVLPEAKVVNLAAAVLGAQPGLMGVSREVNIGQIVEDYKPLISVSYKKIKEMSGRVDRAVTELLGAF